MDESRPLTPEELEERLEKRVEPVLSIRRTAAGPAQQLATLNREQQEFVLHWVGAVAKTNSETAYQFAAYATRAMSCLDFAGVEAWLIHAMDQFDKHGLISAVGVLREAETFAAERHKPARGLPLEDTAGVLQNFVRGLNGRGLRVKVDELIYTDTETLFLPGMVNDFATRGENFTLYKAMAVHQWAQTWYGTWRHDLNETLAAFDDQDKALLCFHALETVRLDACIARDLPGMHRDMRALHRGERIALPAAIAKRLRRPDATSLDSCELVPEIYANGLPPPHAYQGTLRPDRVRAVMEARMEKNKANLQTALRRIQDEAVEQAESSTDSQTLTPAGQPRFTMQEVPTSDAEGGFSHELTLGDKPMPISDDLRSTMDSIIQDFGEIPEHYLVPAGHGEYDYRGEGKPGEREPDDVRKGTYHEDGAFLYKEWDHARHHYRKNWCVLRERDAHPQWDNFVDQTVYKYRGLVKSLRRTFEALRGEDKLLTKQPEGEDVDIDALVEAYADTRAGREMSDRLFCRKQKEERDIAVMFMVDMSGSTKGWINDAEREALVLLCEALETLGDRYAIYGFSGMTRKRCEVYRIKRFDEAYDDVVQARISGIKPQDYTRMGVVIRHLSALLAQVDARTKLLITLSDGKPDDHVDYRGEYGIEDTRQALFEARQSDIHGFCVTIDDQAGDYLPHMYGAVNYAVISDVRKLPWNLSDIYRKLTT
ncbi:MAG: nitric oxide reductase activation protein NorD [Gammaproteobacteria bacterium]